MTSENLQLQLLILEMIKLRPELLQLKASAPGQVSTGTHLLVSLSSTSIVLFAML